MNLFSELSPRTNRMLAALPMADYLLLAPHLEPVQVLAGQVMQEAGAACSHAHFPVDCAVTLVSATRDGEMSELALIGREGVVGLPELLGTASAALQSVVLRPGWAYRLPAQAFSRFLQESPAMQAMAMRYVQNLMLQMAQSVVCSLHHAVLQRLSSWLMYHHTVTASDQVRATHETIAHMLGVRRESITQAAGLLQQAGCLSTSRGRMTLLNPQGLRAHVCECFSMIEQDHRQLWQIPLTALPVRPAKSTLQATTDDGDQAIGDGAEHHEGRYADIYNFAPVGLLSLDSQGQLVEINMAGAIQLGISRSLCTQYRFQDFLQPDARDVFTQFHREVLSGKCRRHCELALQPGAHTQRSVVRLDAVVDESGQESRMVMVDVTESHDQLSRVQHVSPAEERQHRVAEGHPAWWGHLATAGQPAALHASGF